MKKRPWKKRIWVSVTLAVFLSSFFIASLSSVFQGAVFAADGEDINIKLKSGRSDAKITADRVKPINGAANSFGLPYNSGRKQYESGNLPQVSGVSCDHSDEQIAFNITVKDPNNVTIGNLSNVFPCDGKDRTIADTPSPVAQQQGTLSGRITFVNPDTHQTQGFDGVHTTITLTGPTNTTPSIDSNGNFSAGNLKPGNGYTLKATYVFIDSSGNNHTEAAEKNNFQINQGPNSLNLGAADQNSTTPSTPATTTDTQSNSSFSCELKLGVKDIVGAGLAPLTGGITALPAIGKGLNWLVCNIIRAVNGAINDLDKAILDQLDFGSNQLDCNTSKDPNGCAKSGGYYAMWGAFRYISLGILVLFGLFMVISQAVGVGIFDAYTVRKLLPRILIAAVFITLSWTLCKLTIDVVQAIGESIRGIIYAPFGGAAQLASVLQPHSDATGEIAGGMAVGGYFALATTNWLVLLSVALSALVAIAIGFVVIIIRSVVIVLLVVAAPLAIVSFALPNTEKVWKFWHESFTKALIMYPLIVAFLSLGRVFAYVTVTSGKGGLINQIIAIIAYFGPYFLIPATFKFAGGIMSSVGGMVNDRGRGLLDRNKKWRRQNQAKTWQKTKDFNRFSDRNRLTRFANRSMGGVTTGATGHFGLGERGRQARDQATRRGAVERIMKGEHWNDINQNDDALMAATYNSAGEARTALMQRWNGDRGRVDRAVNAVESSIRFGRPQAIAASQQLVSTGTGYANMRDMTQTLARAAGGDENTARALAGFANADTKQRGRFDLAPSYGVLDQLVRNEMAGNGAANDYGAALRESWNSSGLYQLASGKGQATQQYADFHLDRLQRGNQVQKRDAATALMEMQNMLPSATGQNQEIINNTMFRLRNEVGTRLGLDFNDGRSVEDQLAAVATHAANGQPAVDFQGRELTGATIRGQARVYDQTQNPALRDQDNQRNQGEAG